MRSFTEINNEMDNDPSSARNYDRDPMEDLSESVDEMEEYAAQFFAEDNFDENSDFHNQEFSALNNQLDQLQSALDVLESRNADIHQELLQLLQSNREVRRVMEEEMESEHEVANSTDIPVNLEEGADDKVTSSTTQCQPPATDQSVPDPSATDDSTPLATVVTATTTEINLVQSIDAIKLEKVSN